MGKPVRKAVFPVAGIGSRFLPATKLVAKEMLPVVDKPLIHYAVDEAFAAGIECCIFVTGRGKAVLIDYFDRYPELEQLLRAKGKTEQLNDLLGGLPPAEGSIVSARQQSPLGLGHAVWCARSFVADEPFAVILPDDLMMSDRPCIGQLIEAYNRLGSGNIVAVERTAPERVAQYGVLDVQSCDGRIVRASGMVEKPDPDTAPSNFVAAGRYILEPTVMAALANTRKGLGGEIQLTDAIAATLADTPLYGFLFDGTRFDCGDKVGFVEATLAFALKRPEMRARLSTVVKDMAKDL